MDRTISIRSFLRLLTTEVTAPSRYSPEQETAWTRLAHAKSKYLSAIIELNEAARAVAALQDEVNPKAESLLARLQRLTGFFVRNDISKLEQAAQHQHLQNLVEASRGIGDINEIHEPALFSHVDNNGKEVFYGTGWWHPSTDTTTAA